MADKRAVFPKGTTGREIAQWYADEMHAAAEEYKKKKATEEKK